MSPLLSWPPTVDVAGSRETAGPSTWIPSRFFVPRRPVRPPNIRNVEIYSKLARVGGTDPCP
jgi:hypothetical protein